MVNWELKREVEELLAREAHLLDERRFDEWLNLFTDDAEYLVPLREYVEGEVEPAGLPVIRENKDGLLLRVRKDATGFSHTEVPASMTCHLITNIVVDEIPNSDEVEARSAFAVRQTRKLHDEAWWAGRRIDRLRRTNGSWQIAHREVCMDATVYPRGVSIFF
jgi:3-phenylpropionate/cinnamic acid dioxygenase small subunit